MYRILLVDDNVFSRHTLRNSLQHRFPQLVFHEAENGKECLHIMQDVAPEILFIDLQMHDEDGIALMREVKRDYPATILVAASEYGVKEYQDAAHLTGINNIIPKDLWTGPEIATHIEINLVMHGFLPQPHECGRDLLHKHERPGLWGGPIE